MPAELRVLPTQLQAYDTRTRPENLRRLSSLGLDELLTEGIEELRRNYALSVIYGNEFLVGVPVKLDP